MNILCVWLTQNNRQIFRQSISFLKSFTLNELVIPYIQMRRISSRQHFKIIHRCIPLKDPISIWDEGVPTLLSDLFCRIPEDDNIDFYQSFLGKITCLRIGDDQGFEDFRSAKGLSLYPIDFFLFASLNLKKIML